ncbi:MAG: AbrB family transcriptional regulator [Calothrix sp. C42_A2020_038]|nr:AbrB family transcriptional regulator [Calothrix sp. C42_A2020_038]
MPTSSLTPKRFTPEQKPTSVTQVQSNIRKLIILFLEILVAIPLGYTGISLNFGGIAWILAGVAAGIIICRSCEIFCKHSVKPNRLVRQIGMILVGITIGFSNTRANFAHIATGIPIYIILTLFLLLSGACIGYIYSRLSKINLFTAMLATVPGGVGVMAAIAADYNRNVTLVALSQVFRVTSVVILIPLIARASVGATYTTPQVLFNHQQVFSFEPANLGLLCLTLLIAAIAANLALRVKLPAAHFFSALVVGITFNSMINLLPFVENINYTPPTTLGIIGQILLGITIGEYWGEKPSFGLRALVYIIITTVMTLISGATASIIAMHLTSWDWLTCLLVTAPGGAAEMILVALALDHNVDIVTAGHLVRLVAINSSLPLWVYLFRRLEQPPVV